jgi:hypothetical protein
MRSEARPWQSRIGLSLLAAVALISGVSLGVAEYRYVAFRQTLQQIQFAVRLTDFALVEENQHARLRWIVTVTMPTLQIPAFLELLDWHVRSADESTYLGYYTTGEIQVALTSMTEIPIEATIEGPNFEKLQRLLAESPQPTLLFQGAARVMFQLPRAEERKKIPVVGVFTLSQEHP